METIGGQPKLNFTVDSNNLYKEESVTDLKVANIQKLIPIKIDGSPDESRQPVFLARTQLSTPQGPLPIHAQLKAQTLETAIEEFPSAMETETGKVIETFKRMQDQQKQEKDSRIYVPGRDL